MDVAIVGGGIGGLTLALALHQRGVPCRVYESAPEVKELGVGITFLPHAMRQLTALGLGEALTSLGIENRDSSFFNRFGQLIYTEPRGRFAGYPFPEVGIHRGRAHRVLWRTAEVRLGSERVLADHQCVGLIQTDRRVTLHFRSSLTGAARDPVEADLAIACDGVNSVVRRQFYPGEGLRFVGINTWRGVTRARPFLTGRSYVRVGSIASGNIVIYPIVDDVDGDGTQLVNWTTQVAQPGFDRNDWNQPGRLEDFIHIYATWTFDWLDVPDLIRNCAHAYEYPLVDRDPLERWTFGRVTLLGDAAHPMYPIGSNGASQAILDARVLTREILAHGATPEALLAYEAERRPATTDLVMLNRRNGPEQVMQLVEERAPDGYKIVTDVLSQQELEDIAANYKRVAGFQVDALNAKPPIVSRVGTA